MAGSHTERLRRRSAVFDSAADFAIVIIDLDGRVTDWNLGAECILGWSAEEMSGQSADLIFTPEDRAIGRARTEMRLASTDGRASDERWHLRKDGTRFWASGELMPLLDDDKRQIGFVKIVRDRTAEYRAGEALRQTEARLRESEDHFRHTVELNPQVPWTADPQGNIVSYSQRWLDLTGQAPGEPDGAGWLTALHPDDVEPTLAVFSSALGSGEPVDVRYRVRVAATGEYRWMRARAYPRGNVDHDIVRWYSVVEDVHDGHLAEDRLRASEERYRTLFDALDAGFCVFEMEFDDASGRAVDYRFLEVNRAFETQTGLVDAVGKSMRSLAPAHEQAWFDRYGEVARTGNPMRFEDEAAALGRHYDISAFRVGPPEARQVAALFRDITDRRHNEIALRQSEEQFRIFAQAVPNHVWAARPDGYLDWFNDQVYTYSGEASGTLDGVTAWTRIIHPNDLAAAGEAWTGSLATGAIYETEFRIRRTDGAYRWFLVRAEPVRDDGDAVLRWVGTNTDIDDRRRATAELAALNETLEQQVAVRTAERNRVWETTNDLMGAAGLDGYLKSVNPAWTQMLGWSEAELMGRPFLEIVDPSDHAETLTVVQRLATGNPVTGFIDRVLTSDGGQRVVMWNAVPEPETDIFHIIGRDLTEQRQAEEALRQSQKMEAVGQLTGGLAHDFNNLLTGVTGNLELLATRIAQGRYRDVDRYVSAAQGASKRAAALTHRLLAFSRRQTLAPKPTDVNRLVVELEELVRRTVGPAITVEVVAAAGLWPSLVDPNQLENALLNLCINARDAMPEGGRLTIETCNRWMDQRAAAERDLAPGQYISLCVSDTGTGMTPDVIAKAFDPFFTTKPIGQGTGLGLSMIYGFARQSGGQVRIYSEVGDGTMVCIYLPRHLGEAERPEVVPELSSAPRATDGETVLVVDDEPTVRMLVMEVLEELGYAAIEAGDGASGLRVLQSDARIDLLVTDVGLPGGMNGRQMADAARTARPDLKVLFITGYAENAAVGNGHLEPGMHVMTKPFAMEALASRIKELIASG